MDITVFVVGAVLLADRCFVQTCYVLTVNAVAIDFTTKPAISPQLYNAWLSVVSSPPGLSVPHPREQYIVKQYRVLHRRCDHAIHLGMPVR